MLNAYAKLSFFDVTHDTDFSPKDTNTRVHTSSYNKLRLEGQFCWFHPSENGLGMINIINVIDCIGHLRLLYSLGLLMCS